MLNLTLKPTWASKVRGAQNQPAVAVPQGLKRTHKEQLDFFNQQTSRGPPVLSPEYLKFVQRNHLQTIITHSLPQSRVKHGVRVNFGVKNPLILQAITERRAEFFPKAVSVCPKFLEGELDIGFSCKEDADAAATKVIEVNIKGQVYIVPTTRTRWNKEKNIFISMEKLPLDLPRELVINKLKEGLSAYGRVVQFEMQSFYLMPELSGERAIAVIEPSQEIEQDISLIPRLAFIALDDNTASDNFKVYPDRAPPICSNCQALGHCYNSCPTLADSSNEEDDSMEDEIDPGLSESDAFKVDADIPFLWGDNAAYKKVEPMSNKQRKAAEKTIKKKAKNAEKLLSKAIDGMADISSPQNPEQNLRELTLPPIDPQYSEHHQSTMDENKFSELQRLNLASELKDEIYQGSSNQLYESHQSDHLIPQIINNSEMPPPKWDGQIILLERSNQREKDLSYNLRSKALQDDPIMDHHA